MGKATKRTKKFITKHLKKSIEKRHKERPAKQAIKKHFEKKEKRDQAEQLKEKHEKIKDAAKPRQKPLVSEEELDQFENVEDIFENMSVNDLMQSIAETEDIRNINDIVSGYDSDGEEVMEFGDAPPKAKKQKPQPIKDDEDDSDDDDDEEEEMELSAKDRALKHKKELEELKKTQPEFYSYLSSNAKSLLEFDYEPEPEESEAKTHMKKLTIEQIDTWKEATMKKKSVRAMQMLLVSFKNACELSLENDDINKTSAFGSIKSAQVFNHLMFFGLEEFPALLNHVLGVSDRTDIKLVGLDVIVPDQSDESASGDHDNKKKGNRDNSKKPKESFSKVVRSSEQYQELKASIKSYLILSAKFIESLDDENILLSSLQCLERSSIFLYFALFPSIAERFFKVILNTWSSGTEKVKVFSFLVLRSLTIAMPFPFVDFAFRAIFLQLLKANRAVSPHNAGGIQLMINCIVELFGLDFKAAYQTAFTFLRKVALLLRSALTKKNQKSFQDVYNWQVILTLRILGQLVSQFPKQGDIQLLVYPLTQIIIGVVRMIPTGRYYPLRFHCVRILNSISKSTKEFIPVSTLLLQVLSNVDFLKRLPRDTSAKIFEFNFAIKIPENKLHDLSTLGSVIKQVAKLLLEYYATYSGSIAFPELILPAVAMIKKFCKNCSSSIFVQPMRTLLDQLNQNADFIRKHRARVNFAPKDVGQVDSFLTDSNLIPPLRKIYDRQNENLRPLQKKPSLEFDDESGSEDEMVDEILREDSDDSAEDASEDEAEEFDGDEQVEDAEEEEEEEAEEEEDENLVDFDPSELD